MRLITTKSCTEGVFLGKTIYDELGRPLIVAGTKLRTSLIESLLSHNIHMLYVEDSRTDDIDIEDSIPVELRVEATRKIKDTFDQIKKGYTKIDNIVSKNAEEFKRVVKNISEQLNKNKKAISLLSSVKAFDEYVFAHSFNVMVYCVQIALNMGYNDKKIEEIGMGALLHDIGKLLIPSDILHKNGKLTSEEFEIMKEHAELGFNILRKQPEISLLSAHCAYQHHERIDGSGYPRKIKGNEIHHYAKIMGVADVFDAVTSDRVYRKAMLPHEGMELIFSGTGTQFDINVVETFKKAVSIYPEGMGVKLDNGYSGVVTKYNSSYPGRPVVRLLKDPSGHNINSYYDVNLATDLTTMIVDSDMIL